MERRGQAEGLGRRRRRRASAVATFLVVALAATVGSSCGGTSGGSRRADTAAMCAAWRTFSRDATPALPPQPRTEVEKLAARARAAARALAAAATAEWHDLAGRVTVEDGALWQLQLAQWGAGGTALLTRARAADESVEAWASRGGLAVRPDLLVSYTDYLGDRQELDDDLFLACTRRPTDWTPLVDDSKLAVIPARIAVVTSGADLDMGTLDADGSAATRTQSLNARVTSVSFGFDGRLLALVGWTLTVADADGTHAHAVGPADTKWYCPAWSTRVGHVLAAREGAPGQWSEAEVDVDTGVGPVGSAVEPLSDVTCPVPLGATTLLHTVRESPDGLLTVRAGSGLDDAGRPFVRLAGCNMAGPTPSANGGSVAYTVQCRDRYRSGVWVSTGSGESLRQVVAGNAGKPAWLPGGAQLLVSYYPLGARPERAALWVVTADGRRARTVSGLPSGPVSWPAATTP